MTLPASEETAVSATDAEIAALREFAKEATIALTGLTSGGSEFFAGKIGDVYVADIPLCVQRVRERYDTSSRLVADAARRIRSEREQAVRECAEIAETMAREAKGKHLPIHARHIAKRILSLIDRGSK